MKKWIALCLSLVMVLSCCGMAASAEERYLGVMLSTNIMSLDTNLATDGESFEVIADCVDGLMQMDADGAAIPALAESYDLSEDGKTYTFHLRDAKWSNGTPVTAADFVFAWRRICKEAGEYAYMFDTSVGCVRVLMRLSTTALILQRWVFPPPTIRRLWWSWKSLFPSSPR